MVCALYIPEVQFANVLTMEPIVLQYVPHDRFNKVSSPCCAPYQPCPSQPSLGPSSSLHIQCYLILSDRKLRRWVGLSTDTHIRVHAQELMR